MNISHRVSYSIGLLFLAILASEDIRERKISFCKLIFFAVPVIPYHVLAGSFGLKEIAGCLIPGGVLLLLSWMTGESIGYGDGMAVLVLGLWTGGRFTFYALAAGIMLSGFYAAVSVIRKRRDVIPFMPFLLAGMEVALIYE